MQASETVIGLWRSDLGKTGCQPLRVSLLRCGLSRVDRSLSTPCALCGSVTVPVRQPYDTTPVWPAGPVTEEESGYTQPFVAGLPLYFASSNITGLVAEGELRDYTFIFFCFSTLPLRAHRHRGCASQPSVLALSCQSRVRLRWSRHLPWLQHEMD